MLKNLKFFTCIIGLIYFKTLVVAIELNSRFNYINNSNVSDAFFGTYKLYQITIGKTLSCLSNCNKNIQCSMISFDRTTNSCILFNSSADISDTRRLNSSIVYKKYTILAKCKSKEFLDGLNCGKLT